MTQSVLWASGQKVRHPARPEWGEGEIIGAERAIHDGAPCQRLRVRFERAGLKSLLTAVVRLEASVSKSAPTQESSPRGWLEELESQREKPGDLTQLPPEAFDPLSSRIDRARAVLGLYRFSAHGGSLVEWAAMQTGLKDPLSAYTRPQLEQQFAVFERRREEALRALARELAKSDPGALEALTRAAPPAARRALPTGNR